MLLPRGMAVTDDGKLWVAEDDASPNRVSVWDAATGAFLRDYIGPSPYGGGGHLLGGPGRPLDRRGRRHAVPRGLCQEDLDARRHRRSAA